MSKTIKIIDLLNKIANKEIVPEKIKFEHNIYKYFKEQEDYINYADEDDKWYGQTLLFAVMLNHKINEILDATVEIIEEQQDIDIEELDITAYLDLKKRPKWQKEHMIKTACLHTQWKINELIREIKQLDKQIKEKE